MTVISVFACSLLMINLGCTETVLAAESSTSGGVNPTAALIISSTKLTNTVSPGQIAYASSDVRVECSDIDSYTLQISGPSNMSGSTTISGAGNKTPANMSTNTWGYNWGNTGTTNSSLAYKTLAEAGTILAGDSVKDNKVNFTRKLAFATKFAQNANPGHYTASVNLSVAVTPKKVATGFNGVKEMQKMTATTCKNAAAGTTGTMLDTRDNNIYTVAKLEDGNCWMTENLRLIDKKLTSADSDVSTSGYTVPASSLAIFNSTSTIKEKVYYDPARPNYGAYYSWHAAVAGSGEHLSKYESAEFSICPKGWKMPYDVLGSTSSLNTGYYDLLSAASLANNTDGSNKIQGSPYNFVLAGYVNNDNGKLEKAGEEGVYPTSTVSGWGSYDGIRSLRITKTSVTTDGYGWSEYDGCSVRCYVAPS